MTLIKEAFVSQKIDCPKASLGLSRHVLDFGVINLLEKKKETKKTKHLRSVFNL